ncbi:MAG: DUF899 family protein [Pseudomonadota bacterium]
MTEAQKLEMEIMEKSKALAALRRAEEALAVDDYEFEGLGGKVRLSGLFMGRDRLLMIHNMGQGCRYCTLWADGINGILGHLEDAMAVVLVSKDSPAVQRQMALDRNWRFQMISHGGGRYMKDHCRFGDFENFPGAAVYERQGGKIFRKSQTAFGPGDLYSPLWHFLGLAGLSEADWTPQYHYWRRPEKLDDGGENVRD